MNSYRHPDLGSGHHYVISREIIRIEQPQLMFSTWLELAAFRAIKFGQAFVKQKLSYQFEFEPHLNMANDDLAEGDFELYPGDDDRILQCKSVSEVTAELVRNERIPVWIDIAAHKWHKEFTLLCLTCAGRFTNDTGKLYYFDNGTGCFGVKSPVLPPGFTAGKRFKIESHQKLGIRSFLSRNLFNSTLSD
jgi:hypothetical protein